MGFSELGEELLEKGKDSRHAKIQVCKNSGCRQGQDL